jgi:hypothetical protein
MIAETITTTDFASRFTVLKQERFSGKLLLKDAKGRDGYSSYFWAEFCMLLEVIIQLDDGGGI